MFKSPKIGKHLISQSSRGSITSIFSILKNSDQTLYFLVEIGHGKSDSSDSDKNWDMNSYIFEDAVDVINFVRTAANVQSVHWIGHRWFHLMWWFSLFMRTLLQVDESLPLPDPLLNLSLPPSSFPLPHPFPSLPLRHPSFLIPFLSPTSNSSMGGMIGLALSCDRRTFRLLKSVNALG